MHGSFLNNHEEVFHTPTRENSQVVPVLCSLHILSGVNSVSTMQRVTNISAQVCRQLWVAQNTWTLKICQNKIRKKKAKALARKDNHVSDQQHVQQIKKTSCRLKTKWDNPNSGSFKVHLIWRK